MVGTTRPATRKVPACRGTSKELVMKLGLSSFCIFMFAVVVLAPVAACDNDDGGSGGGPSDGSWRVDTFSCNGQPQQIPGLTVNITNTSGTCVIEIPQTCTAFIAEAYSYPKPGTILISPQS